MEHEAEIDELQRQRDAIASRLERALMIGAENRERADRLAVQLKNAKEALRFYADETGNGYDVEVVDYGFTTKCGGIINDSGDRARAVLAEMGGA